MIPHKIDEYGRVILDKAGVLELIYKGIDMADVFVEKCPEIIKFNENCLAFDKPERALDFAEPLSETPEEFHTKRAAEWEIPQEYLDIDLFEFFSNRIQTEEQINRVGLELELFEKHGISNVLRLFIYLVDEFRKNNILWGVGRGSSVASYCLFLIGIHRVDSLLYGLDIKEFIREH